MNKLITLLIILMTVLIVTPVAWAGEHPARTDRHIEHQDLSPAVFFGYTDQDKSDGSTRDSVERVADEKRTDILKDTETSRQDMSPAEFFGYANHNNVAEKAVANMNSPVKMNAGDCHGAENKDLKGSGAIDHALSPAAFFYGIPQPDMKANPYTRC